MKLRGCDSLWWSVMENDAVQHSSWIDLWSIHEVFPGSHCEVQSCCSCACVLSNVRCAGGEARGERVPGSIRSCPGREELPAVCGLGHVSSSGPLLLDKTEGWWSSGGAVLRSRRAAGAQRDGTRRRHRGGRPARFLHIQIQLPRQASGSYSGGPGRARWGGLVTVASFMCLCLYSRAWTFQFESRTYWFHILWSFRSKPCTCTQTASACAQPEAKTRIWASALFWQEAGVVMKPGRPADRNLVKLAVKYLSASRGCLRVNVGFWVKAF